MVEVPRTSSVFDGLDDTQRRAVENTEGPLLLVAGPGAGKTLTLVRRTLNLLIEGLAQPAEIVLCTFTEKAALELRDRVRASAREVGYQGDLSSLRMGTIHGICNTLVDRHRHHTRLGNGYEVLDDLTQILFLFEHFDDVVGPATDGVYLHRWKTKWTAIEGLRRYLDKVTEELIDHRDLCRSEDDFVAAIGEAHHRYEAALEAENAIDFAHLQTECLRLLEYPEVGERIVSATRYVMVDEYQDTNYVQERLLGRLAEGHGNLCVVGDEDQALYRFRGATVRNILEFPDSHPGAEVIRLTTNYRSHERIVAAYDRWMATADWENKRGGPPFRFAKTITPDSRERLPGLPRRVLDLGDESTRRSGAVRRPHRLPARSGCHRRLQPGGPPSSFRSGRAQRALSRRPGSQGHSSVLPSGAIVLRQRRGATLVACFAVVLGWHGVAAGRPAGPCVGRPRGLRRRGNQGCRAALRRPSSAGVGPADAPQPDRRP